MNELTIIGKLVSVDCKDNYCFVLTENDTTHTIYVGKNNEEMRNSLSMLGICGQSTSIKVKAHIKEDKIVATKIFVLIGEEK